MPQVCIRSNVCHLFPPMLEVLFSFPTQLALFLSRFPSPYLKFPDTSVSDTSVSPGQVSFYTNSVGVTQNSLTRYTYIQAHLQVSRLSIAKPTAWKRGCGKVRSTPFPHCRKESVAMLAIFESFFSSNSTQVHMAANVGPKSTIKRRERRSLMEI